MAFFKKRKLSDGKWHAVAANLMKPATIDDGTGTDTPEELTPEMITDVKVRFIPEYSRGQRGQITGRTMLSKWLEWIEVWDNNE